MYASSIFAAFPVALVIIASVTHSSASPALFTRDRHHTAMLNKTTTAHARNGAPPRRTRTKHVIERRSLNDPLTTGLDAYLGQLSLNHDQILSAFNAFSSTANGARSSSDVNSQDTATGLTNFQHSLDPLVPLFAKLGADKGLANYDKSDQYETLLKDIVNANKYALRDTSDLIDADPTLGPLLGQIVYDIKCILDEILNYAENATDALLNSLAPLLKPVILNATGTVCRSIIPPIAGLCLQV